MRSLLLAGGGLKIAFQAGVLQVWLSEAGLDFDHGDAVSAASFNLAMWLNGTEGGGIADHWRAFAPLRAIDVNWPGLVTGSSLLTLDRLRANILPRWRLDWPTIRSSPKIGTFNLFNVSRQELEVVGAPEMDEDRLIAAASLPRWFPPVLLADQVYVDAIHATPANLRHAIAAGADELWIIWTTSTAGRWRRGSVAQYFQIFEEAANADLRTTLADVEASNQAYARGEHAQFCRPISVQLLQAEVPLHYLLNFSQRRFERAVELGVQHARAWCADRGLL